MGSRDTGQRQRDSFWVMLELMPHGRLAEPGYGGEQLWTCRATSHLNSSLGAWKDLESAASRKGNRFNLCSSKVHSLVKNTLKCPGQKSKHLSMISLLTPQAVSQHIWSTCQGLYMAVPIKFRVALTIGGGE